MGSQSRRPTRVPLLTALHKALLLFWVRQHYHWTVDDWKHVTWSDESRFQLYRTDARVRDDDSSSSCTCSDPEIENFNKEMFAQLFGEKVSSSVQTDDKVTYSIGLQAAIKRVSVK
ncbi:hypothetical protein AVEN_129150-1 [Araneus ventricosus]|uniref:Uncharacterized protein n=1 Tax=Araneus ventricosus TaxID=182803 RepID=A0A4Y2T8S7_ARAVE|nr:hypothetical protein AVEN_129150-1 [Araneus ventricosus]